MSLLAQHHAIIGAMGNGGGGADDRIIFLLNGVLDSHQPIQGGLGTPFEDSTLPVQGIKVFENTRFSQDKNIYYVEELATSFDPYEGITLDFWFYTYDLQNLSRAIATAKETASGNLIDMFDRFSDTLFKFARNNGRYMQVSTAAWHHICQTIKVSNYGSSFRHNYKTYVDGVMQYNVNYDLSSIDNPLYYMFYNQSGQLLKSKFKIAQVCVRTGVVWTENFTPPTTPYVKG